MPDPLLKTTLCATTTPTEELRQPTLPFHLGLEEAVIFDAASFVIPFAILGLHICQTLGDLDRRFTGHHESNQCWPIDAEKDAIETSEAPQQLEQCVVYPLDVDSLVVDLVGDRVNDIVRVGKDSGE